MRTRQSSAEESGGARPDWLTLTAFVLLAVFAGGNTVAVRLSNFALPPFWGATLRFGAAAVIFWIVVLVRGVPVPQGRALAGAVLYGLLSIGAAYAFLYWGLVRAPAGLLGALLAFVPLMTLFFAAAHGLERLSWRGPTGAVIATAGVLLGVVGGFGGTMHVPSVLALVAGVACIAESGVVFKLLPEGHPTAYNAVALTTGVPLLAALSLLMGEPWTLPAAVDTWAAYAYLVLIGSVGLFSLSLYVLSRWTASATSYAFLLMPVSSVIIAALLVGEVITFSFVVGVALVIVGVWLGAISWEALPAESPCPEEAGAAVCQL